MTEEIKNFLDSLDPKARERLLKSAEELRIRMEEKERIKKWIIQNDDYFSWLTNFTNVFPSFSDDSFIYCSEKITKIDEENVGHLSKLFEVISEYAEKNYILSVKNEWGCLYNIRYKNAAFSIGVAAGQGTVFYCSRIELNTPNLIDCEMLRLCKNFPETLEINKKFSEIFAAIDELSIQISPYFIKNRIDSYIKCIKRSD